MATPGNQKQEHVEISADDIEPIIQKCEVEVSLQKLFNSKSSGTDGIVIKLIKLTGETEVDILLQICNKIWATWNWPIEWKESI